MSNEIIIPATELDNGDIHFTPLASFQETETYKFAVNSAFKTMSASFIVTYLAIGHSMYELSKLGEISIAKGLVNDIRLVVVADYPSHCVSRIDGTTLAYSDFITLSRDDSSDTGYFSTYDVVNVREELRSITVKLDITPFVKLPDDVASYAIPFRYLGLGGVNSKYYRFSGGYWLRDLAVKMLEAKGFERISDKFRHTTTANTFYIDGNTDDYSYRNSAVLKLGVNSTFAVPTSNEAKMTAEEVIKFTDLHRERLIQFIDSFVFLRNAKSTDLTVILGRLDSLSAAVRDLDPKVKDSTKQKNILESIRGITKLIQDKAEEEKKGG